jgi:hypothetical protein
MGVLIAAICEGTSPTLRRRARRNTSARSLRVIDFVDHAKQVELLSELGRDTVAEFALITIESLLNWTKRQRDDAAGRNDKKRVGGAQFENKVGH